MEIRKVRGLVDAIKASNLEKIEVTLGGCSVRIARMTSASAMPLREPVPALPPSTAPLSATTAVSGTPLNVLSSEYIVRSPWVGTYASGSSSQPPLLAVGSVVKSGDTLGSVMTLNTANRVKAATPGTVVDILINDGQPVEFDQPLFVIG